jgi:hypothetical protein
MFKKPGFRATFYRYGKCFLSRALLKRGRGAGESGSEVFIGSSSVQGVGCIDAQGLFSGYRAGEVFYRACIRQ